MSGQPSGIVYYHPPTPSSQTTIAIDHDSAPQACLRHPSIWMTHHKHSPSSAAILTHTCTRHTHTHMHCRHPTSSPVICCHYRGHTTIHNHPLPTYTTSHDHPLQTHITQRHCFWPDFISPCIVIRRPRPSCATIPASTAPAMQHSYRGTTTSMTSHDRASTPSPPATIQWHIRHASFTTVVRHRHDPSVTNHFQLSPITRRRRRENENEKMNTKLTISPETVSYTHLRAHET